MSLVKKSLMSLLRPHEKEGKQIFAAAGLKVRCADEV